MIDPTCRNLTTKLLTIDDSHRVDAFCVLTGAILLGRRVHISTGARLLGAGAGGIQIDDGCFVSIGATIMTASDNYTEPVAVGALLPEEFRQVETGPVTFEPMSGCGAHAIVMPNCRLGFGARLGANSFLKTNIPAGEIWAGTPARKIGEVDLVRLREVYERIFR